MKRTKLRRFLPILVTLLTVIVFAIGITATASEEEVRSNQITHANLVLDNDVDLVFWADITEIDAQNTSTFMVFNDAVTVSSTETRTLDGVTYAIFKYNNIAPKDLPDVINAKLYVNGVYTSYIDYSVKNYCQYVLTNTTSDTLKALISDLLVYGEKSQALVKEDPDTFVTNGLVGLTPSKAPESITVLYDKNVADDLSRGATASLSASQLIMQNGIELNFEVELPKDADPSEYTVCLTINGREQEVPIISKVTLSGYENRVSFKGIYSYELFDQAEINVYKNSYRVSKTMTFSLASYIKALHEDQSYTDITNAYYNYCYSSHIYAGTHTVVMPGEILADGKGNSIYDDSGKLKFNCSLCGLEITSLTATHIRTFDAPHTGGSPSNKGEYTIDGVKYTGTIFSLDTTTEEGSENKHLAITYKPEDNKAVGSLGYYMLYNQSRPAVSTGIVDSKAQYDSKQFTFSTDVKAPSAGLGKMALYLRNTNADSNNSERFGELLTINPDGSIVRGNTKIAPHSTINSSEWTTLTVTIDIYENNGDSYMFLEYYANDVLLTAFSIANPMYEEKFTCLYFSMSNSGLYAGQGILFDNMVFAQGLVHSFSEDVVSHIAKLEGGSIRKIIDKVQNDFDIEDFSYVVRWDGKSERTTKEYQAFVTLDRNKYNDPDDPIPTPTSYDHPRVLFNSSDIPNIVANIEAPENALAKNAFLALVNSTTDGKLADPVQSSFEYTNYNTSVLKIIEAKALFYALYKDNGGVSRDEARLRGYEAIYAMKNYLLTFDVQWKASDQCRYYGEVMYYSALVYDWCYDLLTEDDKAQFMVGVQNLCCDGTNNMPWAKREGATGSANGVALNTHEARKLEGGFPALAKEDQSRLTGHGAEAQVLRDYFSFAIAIFDEDSSWYSYVGGMIYKEYVDARNYFYQANFYPDGSAGYNTYRFLCDLYNAWLFDGMGVELPYDSENMASVIHGLASMETYDGFQFATADGSATSWSNTAQYRLPDNMGDCALISSYLFEDDAALAIAHYILDYRWNRGSFSNSQLSMSAAYYLILTSKGLTPAEDYREKIDNVEYHGAFEQNIVARNGFSEDSVAVYMQGAQHLPGGHTHQNAGNFQIWYKGMLTRDDGLYDAYGSDHHHYYHAAAVAHNTLLIYNPDRADSGVEPVGRQGFYNGGQRAYFSIPATYSKWIDDDRFSYGKLIGWQTDSEQNPSYVYFANDITNAYESDTVDYVERSFMTVFTGDDETPMVMFVFDNITSDGADFQKTFLLQCATAPIVDTENSTVTVDNGEGKLVLTSLLGNDTIKAYGRTSKDGVVMPDEYFETHPNDYMAERFYLSGQDKNLLPGGASSIGDKNSDLPIVWGHVEIQPEANSYTNQLMNVLYVSDSGTTVSATPTLIQGTYLTGATFKNHTSVFITDPMHSTDPLSFTATADAGIETMTYYVGGLSDGEWKIYINGEQIYAGVGENGDGTNFQVTEDGRMLTFTGPVGEVTIEPSDSMRPQGAVGLAFNLNGGKWEEGEEPLNYYIPGTAVQLPIPTKKGAEFGGWYTDKNFEGDPITEIPEDATEVYRLYAKWMSPILYVDYTKEEYSQITKSVEAGGGTTWDVTNDPVDGTYFLWTNSLGSGSILQRAGAYASYANQSLQVSYTLSLGRHGTSPLLPLQLYFRDDAHNRKYANIFSTDASGNVFLGLNRVKIGEIASSGISTFHFVLDFATGKAIAYDDNGNEIVNTTMSAIGVTLPTGCKNYAEWFRTMTSSSSSLFALKGNGTGTIRVYGMQILSGNLTENCKNFGANSDKHDWDDGVVVSHPSATDCTPGVKVYTCQNDKCGAVKEVALTSEIPHQTMTSTINKNNKLEYTCTSCGCTFLPGAYYHLDGTSHDGIIGVGNSSNFTTKSGTNQPAINAGAYELINTTGKNGNIELWVPGRTPMMGGFSAENNAAGFVSFKINALTTNTFDFNFVDTSSTGTKWSSDWCITDSFFRVFAPTTIGNKTTVKVTGWDGVELANIELRSEMSFTEWLDVKIYIELDKATDKIILHYYIGGEYKATVSRELTTSTNAINSICITGSTSAVGSGLKLDDIAFGFTANGAWEAPKN